MNTKVKVKTRNLLADMLGVKPECVCVSADKLKLHFGNPRVYLTKLGVEVLILQLQEIHKQMES